MNCRLTKRPDGLCIQRIQSLCRQYTDIAEKLGGQEEAADAMGKLLRNVASRFADETATVDVSLPTMLWDGNGLDFSLEMCPCNHHERPLILESDLLVAALLVVMYCQELL